jgi:GT2 family glycosyltransferase
VAVIIPTHNNRMRLRKVLESWHKVDYDPMTIIVVNDGCTDGTDEMLGSDFPRVVQLKGDGNLWFAGSCNAGLRYALEHHFDYATVFNDDNYVEPDILRQQTLCAAKNPGAILGIKSYKLGTNREIWANGGIIAKRIIGLGTEFPGKDLVDDGVSYEELYECELLDGSGQFYPLEVVRAVGFWDERYLTYYADVEYTLRAKRKGFRIISNPKAVAWHDYQESDTAKKNTRKYRWQLIDLLFNTKSSYHLMNTLRFWFTYYPWSSFLTIPRHYAAMIRVYYVHPIFRGRHYRR